MKADIVSCTRMCLYIHVSHSVRNLTGVKAHLDCPNLNLVPFYDKTAHVEPHHHALHLFTWFFCNHICLLQQQHTTQKYAIWWSGWSAVKILWWKVGSTLQKIRHVRPKLLCSSHTNQATTSNQTIQLRDQKLNWFEPADPSWPWRGGQKAASCSNQKTIQLCDRILNWFDPTNPSQPWCCGQKAASTSNRDHTPTR